MRLVMLASLPCLVVFCVAQVRRHPLVQSADHAETHGNLQHTSLPARIITLDSERIAPTEDPVLSAVGRGCWLRIRMGPVLAKLDSWQRHVICTGSPVTIGDVRGIVTAAHCFYWHNKNRERGFDWDNRQIQAVSKRNIIFTGTIEAACDVALVDERQTLLLRPSRGNPIVRLNPEFSASRNKADVFNGSSNIAFIELGPNCDDTLSKLNSTWSMPPLAIPQSKPTSGTLCEIISYIPQSKSQRSTKVHVTSDHVCRHFFSLPVNSKAFCVESRTKKAPLNLPDNGGPVMCQERGGYYSLAGVGYILNDAVGRIALIASTYGNAGFLRNVTASPFARYPCVQ